MRNRNFHVRHITFKCCLNYLLAWRLWEKPAARLHGRMAREAMLLCAHVYPNASNCRSPYSSLQIENRNFGFCVSLVNSDLPDHVWVAPNEVPYTPSRPAHSNRHRAVRAKEVMILRSCFDLIDNSFSDWLNGFTFSMTSLCTQTIDSKWCGHLMKR